MAQYTTSPRASRRKDSVRLGTLGVIIALLCTVPLVVSASGHGQQYVHRSLHEARAPQVEATVEVSVGSKFWLEDMPKRGRATYNGKPDDYVVRRNVKDFGAKGDGTTDDTAAINDAIRNGGRCGDLNCESSTIQPAIIYFPSGVYIVSAPIVAMYYSQLVGNPLNRPTIKGSPGFKGLALVDSNPYSDMFMNDWYPNENNFFRGFRNFIVDTTAMPPAAGVAVHWQVARATSMVNVHFELSQVAGNRHQGILVDNSSGGFMSDLSFNGGYRCAFLGSHQFTTRNLKFTNCKTAIYMDRNWQWTFKSVSIDNCGIGIEMDRLYPVVTDPPRDAGPLQTTGSVLLLDSTISNTPYGINTARSSTSAPISGGTLVLDNVRFTNVANPVYNSVTAKTLLTGSTGTTTVDLWGQGRDYSGKNLVGVTAQGPLVRSFPKPASLLRRGANTVFERSRPQYENFPVSDFVSVKGSGAKGDGIADDTVILQNILDNNIGKIIFFDLGHYVVSDTVTVPMGTRIVGEIWSVIVANGVAFQDVNNPRPVFRIGKPGDTGMVEISELLFQTKGPQVGAILMEWNSRDPAGSQGVNGMWDVHFRVGGSAGTNLNSAECKATPNDKVTPNPACYGAFMLLHIGKTASVYMENIWAWTSDHEIDFPYKQITIYNGRGIYTESTDGPVWMYGVASEHNVLYQYQMHNTKNLFMAVGQTETPYFQSNPVVNVVHPMNTAFNDPVYGGCRDEVCEKSWGLRIVGSSEIHAYGVGLYSFYDNYLRNCSVEAPQHCQENILSLEGSQRVTLLNLNTVGAIHMVNVDNEPIMEAEGNPNYFASTLMRYGTAN